MKTWIAALLLAIVSTTLAAQAGLKEELLAIERMSWTAWGNGDAETYGQYYTEDAVHVVAGIGTVVGRDAIVADLAASSCELTSFEFHDVTLRSLAPDVAALSYQATQDASCDGTKLPAKIYSTSVYVRTEGTWLAASYQETPID